MLLLGLQARGGLGFSVSTHLSSLSTPRALAGKAGAGEAEDESWLMVSGSMCSLQRKFEDNRNRELVGPKSAFALQTMTSVLI